MSITSHYSFPLSLHLSHYLFPFFIIMWYYDIDCIYQDTLNTHFIEQERIITDKHCYTGVPSNNIQLWGGGTALQIIVFPAMHFHGLGYPSKHYGKISSLTLHDDSSHNIEHANICFLGASSTFFSSTYM